MHQFSIDLTDLCCCQLMKNRFTISSDDLWLHVSVWESSDSEHNKISIILYDFHSNWILIPWRQQHSTISIFICRTMSIALHCSHVCLCACVCVCVCWQVHVHNKKYINYKQIRFIVVTWHVLVGPHHRPSYRIVRKEEKSKLKKKREMTRPHRGSKNAGTEYRNNTRET